MTNEGWLRWAIAKHFREKGYVVNMNAVKVGNATIDGEVVRNVAPAFSRISRLT